MSRTGRNSLLIALVAALAASFSLSVLAASEEGETGTEDDAATTTTIDSGLSPAVEVSDGEAAPPQADWTYRYLIPTVLALAAVVVLVTAVKYFTDVVRKRYRIIEE